MAKHPPFPAEPIGIQKGDHKTKRERNQQTTKGKKSGGYEGSKSKPSLIEQNHQKPKLSQFNYNGNLIITVVKLNVKLNVCNSKRKINSLFQDFIQLIH